MNDNSADVIYDNSTGVMNAADVMNSTDAMDYNSTDAKNYNATDVINHIYRRAWEISFNGEVIITIIWGIILLVGIIGNLLVITLILLVKTMRSAVNLALLSLAIVDLMVVVFLPILPLGDLFPDHFIIWNANFCLFLNSIDRPAIVCSLLTFLLVGVERYTAVCHPLRFRGMWTPKRVCLLLGIIWAISVGVSVPYGYVSRFDVYQLPNVTRTHCNMKPSIPWFMRYETAVIFVFIYLPIPILLLLYAKVILALRRKSPRRNTQGSESSTGQKSRSQIALMLVVLVVIFLISIIPSTIFQLIFLNDLILFASMGKRVISILAWFTRILVYINHSANPIVYFLMSGKFRDAFSVVFCRPCKKGTSLR